MTTIVRTEFQRVTLASLGALIASSVFILAAVAPAEANAAPVKTEQVAPTPAR